MSNSYNEPINLTNPTLSLRNLALDAVELQRKAGEQERKTRRAEQNQKRREGARDEAHRAVARVFTAEFQEAVGVEYVAHEEEGEDYFNITYEIRVQDMRFHVGYQSSGGGPSERIGLLLFDACKECGREHQPRTVVVDAVSLGYAIETLDEYLRDCKHGADEVSFEEDDASGPDEDVKEPATAGQLPGLAAAEHTAALEAAEAREAKYAEGRARTLCQKLKATLNLAEEPEPLPGIDTFDGVKCVRAKYGTLVFAAMNINGSEHSIYLIQECAACSEMTLAKETVYDRRSLGRALADGTVEAWYKHPRHAPHGEEEPDLKERLRSLLNEVLDREE